MITDIWHRLYVYEPVLFIKKERAHDVRAAAGGRGFPRGRAAVLV